MMPDKQERDAVISEAITMLGTVFALNRETFKPSYSEQVEEVLSRARDGGIMGNMAAEMRWKDARWLKGRMHLLGLAIEDLAADPDDIERVRAFKIALLDLARSLKYLATGSGSHDDKPDDVFGARLPSI